MISARHRFGRRVLIWACIALFCWLLTSVASAEDEPVTVFAASSLTDAVTTIAEQHEIETGQSVRLSFASSSTLARQIEGGAPADIFISASADWMEYLAERNLILAGSHIAPIGNRLVWIGPADQPAPPQDALSNAASLQQYLGGIGRIAMGDPAHVPAGIYGKEALASLGLWSRFAPNVVQTDNVRAALRLVASGQVPFGIVYVTEARAEARVRIIHRFPPSRHQDIPYPMAIVAGKDRPAVRALWPRLQSPAAGDIFRANGFIMKAHGP